MATPSLLDVDRSGALGLIGGAIGDRLLNWAAPIENPRGYMTGKAYETTGKLQVLLGETFFADIQGKTVLDFGCGPGAEAVEIAQRGARRVLGIDIRESFLEEARRRAASAGVADRCVFMTAPDEPADLIVSVDSFEHFKDPAAILRMMDAYLAPHGKVIASFGHLLFSEKVLLRWRKKFRPDQKARRIAECGLNAMTLRRFERLVAASPFRFERYRIRPIRGHRWLSAPLIREFGTSVVTCTMVKRSNRR
jgi:2-polyprenyl-3-methyl-5-hydroxy-6-metoxy-1,4-benzoquinol methylase